VAIPVRRCLTVLRTKSKVYSCEARPTSSSKVVAKCHSYAQPLVATERTPQELPSLQASSLTPRSVEALDLSGGAASPTNIEALESALPNVIERATSPEAIVKWLASQPSVSHVQLVAGILKSNPPQFCLVVDFKFGSAPRAVYIDILAADRFRLNSIIEQKPLN
jgi:hypothetical protein